MTVSIHIPTALRSFAGGNATVAVDAATAGQALEQLAANYPGLRKHLFNDQGGLRSFVNIYVNDEDIRHQSGVDTPVAADSNVLIVPSIAGGHNPCRCGVAHVG